MTNSTADAISKLISFEKNAIENIPADTIARTGDIRTDYKSLVEASRRAFAHSTEPFRRSLIREWGCSLSSVPVPVALLLQSAPVVDIIPETLEEFQNRLGVEPWQLRLLAERGHVIPNLAYDTEFLNFAGCEIDVEESRYAKHPYLAEIIDPESCPITINGLRRARVFDAMSYGADKRTGRLEEFNKKLMGVIGDLSVERINDLHLGMKTKDREDAAVKLAHQMTYLDSFSLFFDLPFEKTRIKDFRENPDIGSTERLLKWISGRKAYLCAHITAGFGGVQTLVGEELARSYAYSYGTVGGSAKRADSGDVAGHEFLLWLSEAARKNTYEIPANIDLPMQDAQFYGFLDFLDAIKPLRDQTSILTKSLKAVGPSFSRDQTLEKLVEIHSQIRQEMQRGRVFSEVASAGAAGAAGWAIARGLDKSKAIAFSESAENTGIGRRPVLKGLFGFALGGAAEFTTGAGAKIIEKQVLGRPGSAQEYFDAADDPGAYGDRVAIFHESNRLTGIE